MVEDMDGDGWSDGHLALFDALETICKAVGEETAAGLFTFWVLGLREADIEP